MQKVCYICKRKFNTDKNDENAFKVYNKVSDHCHYAGEFRGTAHSICNLRYKTPKEIPVVFHNGYHFIFKQLAKEFEGQFKCLGEKAEKYITFSIPIKKKLDVSKTITYKLKFIDSFRFMLTPLSSLIENLHEIYNKKCIDENFKSECEFSELKNNRLQYNCHDCEEIQLKPIGELIKKFPKKYKFCNIDINKFILLLRKGVYLYEYMDSYERFNETLPDKKAFYRYKFLQLNLEDITDKDYTHSQKAFKEFKLKNLGDYHDLYVQRDALLLEDLFETFRNKCMEISELNPAHF